MSRPVFLVAAGSLAAAATGAGVVLDGAEGRHAAAVRRVRPGEHVDLVDGEGLRARTAVAAVRPSEVELTVLSCECEPPPAVPLVLVQALAKGGRDERAVETATEVGVDAVVPWQSERSVVRWSAAKAERGVQRWRAVAGAAAKQARRARVPVVRPHLPSSGASRVVADTVAADGAVVVLDERADLPLREVRLPDKGEVVVVVGPEGGLTDAEVATFAAAGAQVARLGPHVLRTSTAGPVALALLAERLGRWAPSSAGR